MRRQAHQGWRTVSLALSAFIQLTLAPLGLCAEGPPVGSGAAAYLVQRGDTVLASANAEQLFVPASSIKILLVCLALHHLGPDYRVSTRVAATTLSEDGVIAGDLRILAAGDPTWNQRFFPGDGRAPLRELAAQLARRGVRRVEGDLVLDRSAFPGRSLPLSRSLADLPFAFAAPATALAVDENTVRVRIAPGASIGAPGRAESLSQGVAIEDDILTVGRQRHGRGTVDFLPDWRRPAWWIRGEYPVSEPPYTVDLSLQAAEIYAAAALAKALAEAGISLVGKPRLATFLPRVPVGQVLAEVRSPPLQALLPVILQESHNWYAEMVLRLVAREVTGEGRLDSGLDLARDFLLGELAAAPASFVLDDASGLSPYNLLTPRLMVDLLAYARKQPWGKIFMAALARPGQGTLQAWPSLPPVAAKSGTLRQALALVGYLEPEADEPVLFAYLFRTKAENRAPLRSWVGRQLEEWVPVEGAKR